MVSMEKEKTTPLGKSEGAEPERFIPDGMGMFQRNVKRFTLLYRRKTGGWRPGDL